MVGWQRLGIFCQVLEVRNTGFKSQMGAIEGGIPCCAFCDKCVGGWVKLDDDGTMKKGYKSKIWNPYPSHDDGVRESVKRSHKSARL
eukprot:1065855-Ditylum_brightwellii.AAC.1